MTYPFSPPRKREQRAAKGCTVARPLLSRLTLCIVCALSACAFVPGTPDPATMTGQMLAHPNRMIILAVANPPETLTLRAGSTSRGYGAATGYSTSDSARATIAALARQYGLREVSAWPIPSLNVHCAMLEISGDAPRDQVVAQLAVDARVNLAEPLHMFHTLASAPAVAAYSNLEEGLHEIGADAAQKVTRGDSVDIAVIDTGIDTLHPDLRDRIAATQNFVDDDWDQFNRDQHGTEVAGIIAADHPAGSMGHTRGMEGVAPHARIIALKACWQDDPSGPTAVCHTLTLAEALQAAMEAHAQVVNLSLGGPPDPLLTELVALLIKKGVIVVGAVEPDGDMNAFPVGVPGVIAVESARRAGDTVDALSSLVLYAPGRNVLTLTPGGNYDFVSGSSFAAAYVTASAALLVGLRPQFTANDLSALLRQTSGSTKLHASVINVCRAIAALHRSCTDSAQ